MLTGEEARQVFIEKLQREGSYDAAMLKLVWFAYCRGIEDANKPIPVAFNRLPDNEEL